MVDYRPFGPKHEQWRTINVKDSLKEKIQERKDNKMPMNRRIKNRIRTRLKTRAFRQSLPQGRDVSGLQTDAPGQIIYGTARVSGTITFLASNTGRQHLHQGYTLSCHEVNDVTSIYVDGVELTMGGDGWADGPGLLLNKVYWNKSTLGSTSQTANTDMVTNCPNRWGTSYKQRGCCLVYVMLVWDSQVFKDGPPDIEFLVQGKKCYDHRILNTVHTANPALCIADFLMDTNYGPGFDTSEIDWDSVDAAADVCDETVNGIARYTLNGYFDTDKSWDEVLAEMCSAMAGDAVFVGGKWTLLAGEYRTPLITLTIDDLVGQLRVGMRESRDNLFNYVFGTYVDAGVNYEVTDFSPISNATYANQDGGVLKEEISVPFTTNSPTAQRLAKIALEDHRQCITVNGYFSLKAYQLVSGDNVYLTLDRYGWSSKTFRVEFVKLVELPGGGGPMLGVELDLKETTSGIYDWNDGEETVIDLSPNTDLPIPYYTPDIEGLLLESGTDQLDVRLDGTVFSRIKISWAAATDYLTSSGGFVRIRYRKTGDSDWIWATPVPADSTFAYILDVKDGVQYDVSVQYQNAFGFGGNWAYAYAHTVAGKTEAPSTPTDFRSSAESGGMLLTWTAVADVDVQEYEIRIGTDWDTATFLWRGRGTAYRWKMLTAGNYALLIKAIDTSGNYSTSAASHTAVVTGPGSPQAFSRTIDGTDIVLTWQQPLATQFAVRQYTLSYGSTYAGRTEIITTKSLRYRTKVNWSGERVFWVTTEDEAGNISSPATVSLTINPSSAVATLNADVVDNNALLKWTAPSTHQLPIDYYNVYRGDLFTGATLLGRVSGTFATYFETTAGDYTYWVAPVDSAGNQGTEKSVVARILAPPDFVVREEQDIDSWDTVHNFLQESDYWLGPVDPDIVYDTYFTTLGWDQESDGTDAGMAYYFQPTASYAYMEKTIDFGAVISSGTVNILWNEEDVDPDPAAVSVVPYISVSEDGATWRGYADTDKVFESSFQYVKIKLEIGTPPSVVSGTPVGLLLAITGATDEESSTTGRAAVKVRSPRVKIDVKVITDEGSDRAESSDSGGTVITFNKTFVDIRSIVVTPNTTEPLWWAVDFTDAPNPTSFKVLFWDSNGVRKSVDFTWTARGI